MAETISSSMTIEATQGCGCPACMNGSGPDLYESLLQDPEFNAPSITATKEQFADYLIDGFWNDFGTVGRQWAQNTVTFSLSNEFSSSQKEGFRMAFDQWADVTNLSFSEVSSGGDMTILEGDDGRAFSSSSVDWNGNITSNTISIDTASWYWQNFDEMGDYAMITAIHEIGHSLGLGHTGDYNGSASYANDAQFVNDSHQYSVMSYFDAGKTGANHLGEYASTPLVMDIYAIQQIYGADMTTRAGDTTYGFNSNAGRDQFDFTVNTAPVVAIWDAGGTDTLDLSGYSNTQMINLGAGEFSNIGGGTGNLAIAYGVTIENAIGGSGGDAIYGNDAANILSGGAGNDTIYGSLGSDTLDGGSNTDAVSYNYDISAFLVALIDSVTVTLQHIAEGFIDTLSNFENYIFNDTSYSYNDISAFDTSVQDRVDVKFTWDGGGSHRYKSTSLHDDTLDASQLSYTNGSGNIARFERTNNQYDITLLDAAASGTISMGATVGDDVHNIYNAGSNLTVKMYGNGGADQLTLTGSGKGLLYGMAGDDTLQGGDGNDKLYGDKVKTNDVATGNDTLRGGDGSDTLYGNGGDDDLYGENHNDYLYGGDGADQLSGGAGVDRLYGQDGDDVIYGDAGNDRLYGDLVKSTDNAVGNDTMYGGDGVDTIFGHGGDDVLYGGNDTDYIYGQGDNDMLYGDGGNDILRGGDGNDRVEGGVGVDVLYGNAGDDTLIGGEDRDYMYGGDGHDIFGFTEIHAQNDVIYDFAEGGSSSDAINITDILIGYDHGVDNINDFAALVYRDSDRTDLLVNADGQGSDWQNIVMIRGDNLLGTTMNDMLFIGNVIANQSLL